ncbi:hypothetical protein [Gloeothece verrucosa]|uniref:Uncharacterized protein n=1 Tax=Gloeothece verrucosa (strain PCC 7822) TaxID=497965 RepID=E0ULV2_GLOV7|nr:hypothetical protein [Gloeothece verrucosa]ADN17932.1 hypothetical protein Cyan7822_6094 [Gloeothece verrucosa PCC 7822]
MRSPNNFYTLINQISEQVNTQLNESNNSEFEVALAYAIKSWCNYLETHPKLNLLFTSEMTYNILSKSGQASMPQLTYNIYQEWRSDQENKLGIISKALEVPNGLTLLINKIFTLLKIKNDDLKIIVLFAFVFVAVLFLNNIINNPQKKNLI